MSYGEPHVSGGPAGGQSYVGPVSQSDPTSFVRWTTPDYQGYRAWYGWEDNAASWERWLALGRPVRPS